MSLPPSGQPSSEAALMALEDNHADNSDTESDSSEEEESTSTSWFYRHRFCRNLVVVLLYFLTGVFFVEWQERWGLVTTVYVVIQIITTIGYGDITVQKASSQWFMIFYVFVGVLITANIVNDFIDRHLQRYNEAMRTRLRRMEAHLMDEGMRDDEVVRERYGALNGMLVAGLIYFGFLMFGTFFYAFYEACTCSYAETHVDGCERGDQCFMTGGYRKSFREAIYMSVITLCTTGFGDYAPKTKLGRLLALVWMPLGVLSWVNFLTSVLIWWRALRKVDRHHKLAIQEIKELDDNHDGRISRAEFRVFFLLKEEIVKKADIKSIDDFFASLDKDNRGWVTEADMRRSFSAKSKIRWPI